MTTDSNAFRKSYYAGIFLVAAATLLLEITLTKVFSVIHYHYFAFLIVSTALFGYGFSGVFLSVFKWVDRVRRDRLLFGSALLFSVTLVAAYRLILATPLRLTEASTSPEQLTYLAVTYLLLALPFFFSGMVIGVLLTYFSQQINRLYFADLTGAGIGCFAIVLAVPLFGGSGTVLVAGIVAALACMAFAARWSWNVWPALVIAVLAWMVPQSETYFPSTGHTEKRYFKESLEKGEHWYTGWSPASRIDVVRIQRERAVIWIDGGTNQSFMRKLDKDDTFDGPPPEFVWKTVEIPYALVKNPSVMIIGPGGGIEVGSALGYQPKSITAVELDPLIVKIVKGQFAEYTGEVYMRPGVQLINEEGRSYVRRSGQKFDIIQQKNSSHPMAVASGALNLTETYLLTKEGFNEFLDHLNPGGFVTIERHGGIRLLNLGAEVLKDRGVQNYWKQLVMLAESPLNQVFLMKNGEFTDAELDYIEAYSKASKDEILYSPRIRDSADNVFSRLMRDDQREQILREAPFHMEAPTDDKPFIEHFYRVRALWDPSVNEKLKDRFWEKAALNSFVTGQVIYSDLSLYVILGEALLLSSVFIILPLFKLKRSGLATRGSWHLLLYYFCLGLAFIFVEISLIQKYILFIGYPVYAVAVIIFSLLIAAGAGSWFSGRFSDPFRGLRYAVAAIVILTAFQIVVAPYLFHRFLSVSFTMRMVLSILSILPAGFFMGMPFPIGLTWTAKRYPGFVAWAWGINGYATVIGSVLSVILALNFGFHAVLMIAAGIYIIAYLVLRTMPVADER